MISALEVALAVLVLLIPLPTLATTTTVHGPHVLLYANFGGLSCRHWYVGREVAALYRVPPHSTALWTSREGVGNSVSHSLKSNIA